MISAAIAKQESNGNYKAIGKPVNGDVALGKYQIMKKNLPSWSQEALGRKVSVTEFMTTPEIQDAIAKFKMNQYYMKYKSPADVASMWFSGRPLRNNKSFDKVSNLSTPNYVSSVLKHLSAVIDKANNPQTPNNTPVVVLGSRG